MLIALQIQTVTFQQCEKHIPAKTENTPEKEKTLKNEGFLGNFRPKPSKYLLKGLSSGGDAEQSWKVVHCDRTTTSANPEPLLNSVSHMRVCVCAGSHPIASSPAILPFFHERLKYDWVSSCELGSQRFRSALRMPHSNSKVRLVFMNMFLSSATSQAWLSSGLSNCSGAQPARQKTLPRLYC